MLHKKNIYLLLLYTLLISSSHAIAIPDLLYFGTISQFIWNKISSFSYVTKTYAEQQFAINKKNFNEHYNDVQTKINEYNKKETEETAESFNNLNKKIDEMHQKQNQKLVTVGKDVSILKNNITSNDDKIINLNTQTSFLHKAQNTANDQLKILNTKAKKTTNLLQKNKRANESLKNNYSNLKNQYYCLKNNFDKMLIAYTILQEKFKIVTIENEKSQQYCDTLIKDNQNKDSYITSLKNFIIKNYIVENGANTIIDKPTNNSFAIKKNNSYIDLQKFNLIDYQNYFN